MSKMNRRQFLTGVSAAAVAGALPAAPALSHNGITIAFDLASGPDRMALWLIESTPGSTNWVWRRFYDQAELDSFLDLRIDGVWPEHDDLIEWFPNSKDLQEEE